MPKTLIRPYYQNLLTEISSIYTDSKLQARSQLNEILTKAYWEIGKRIVTVEQDNELRAQYGGRLLERLSKDLTEQHGNGFSLTNLKYIRKFYLKYPKGQPVDLFSWSKHVVLLSVKNEYKYMKYKNLAISQNWSRAKLIDALKNENLTNAQTVATPGAELLKPYRGPLYTYSASPGGEGIVYVDVGFAITRQIKSWVAIQKGETISSLKSGSGFQLSKVRATSKDLYTYKAYCDRVIDGDTIKFHIDLGFDTFISEVVRLRGINTPEIKTKEGQRAKRFVTRILSGAEDVIVKTHREDKYGRTLADIWVNDIYLNQRLLDEGLAVLF